MSDSFDPYHAWLGIPLAEQPPHNYRLLGLPIFEADAERIRAEADHRMRDVRTHQLGAHSRDSQKILNELAGAKVCLLNPAAKAKYDAALTEWIEARLPVPPPMLPPEAPPLSSPEEDEVLPAGADAARAQWPELETPAGPAIALATVSTSNARIGSGRGRGWAILGTVAVVALVCGVAVFAMWRSRHGIFHSATDGTPPVVLPTSDKTATANLAGKTVAVGEHVVVQDEGGDIDLPPQRAALSGTTLKLDGGEITGWTSPDDRVAWEFVVHRPGFFMIEVTYAADAASAGGLARIDLSGQPRPLTLSIRDTGGRGTFVTDPTRMVMIKKGGGYTLSITAAEQRGEVLMALRNVHLRRAPVR